MAKDWKIYLRAEILDHLALALVILSMLALDFLPVAFMLSLMRVSEKLVNDKNFLGTSVETIMSHIEIFLLAAFMALGGFKILMRLGVSMREMNNAKNAP